MLERPHVVVVEEVGFEGAALPRRQLLAEALGLHVGVVELGEAVGDLHAAGVELEALGEPRIVRALLGERRDLDRIVDDERRLHQVRLDQVLEERHQQVPVAAAGRCRQAARRQLRGERRGVLAARRWGQPARRQGRAKSRVTPP